MQIYWDFPGQDLLVGFQAKNGMILATLVQLYSKRGLYPSTLCRDHFGTLFAGREHTVLYTVSVFRIYRSAIRRGLRRIKQANPALL